MACGATQMQHIGTTGADYSLSHDTFAHFGLGDCTETIEIEVTWSNVKTETRSLTNDQSTVKTGN